MAKQSVCYTAFVKLVRQKTLVEHIWQIIVNIWKIYKEFSIIKFEAVKHSLENFVYACSESLIIKN